MYGLTATNLGYGSKNDKSYASLGLNEGDKIKIHGYRGSFNDKIEVMYAWFIEKVTGGGGGDTPSGDFGSGTLADPYTPAGAANAVKDLTWTSNTEYQKTEKVYVKGKISRIANKGTFTEGGTYGNASFYISADGTENGEFYVFRTLYFNGEKYTSGTDIKVGDEVIIYGALMNYQGKTPTSAPQLAAGEHKVRVELDGHATQERTVRVENGGDTTESFEMESVLGRIEIVTVPAGAKVSLDGKAVGTTRTIEGSAKSAVLAIEKVSAGERAIVVTAPGCQDVARKVKVPAKETASVTVVLKRLFVPDTEIETIQGTTRRGVLIGDGKELDGVHLEVSPGVEQVFPHDTVRKMRPIPKGR